uniref:Scavenger receptor cysteine-rich type 1 protein M130-like n=1 Tax=Macrostomum lignano TaxID=282301 RepID=A0A1I8GEC2_9PLAT
MKALNAIQDMKVILLVILTTLFPCVLLLNANGLPGKESRDSIEMQIKLIDGHTSMEGTVMLRFRRLNNASQAWSLWGLLCDDGWSTASADVVCKQLGFGPALQYTVANKFQTDLRGRQILLDDVRCSGSEADLSQCRSRSPGQHNCEVGEAAGVRCSAAGRVVELNSWRRPENTENTLASSTKRIVLVVFNGSSSSLQAPADGLCADSYVTLREASVACRELGLGAARTVWKHPVAPEAAQIAGSARISPALSVAGCRGGEARLSDCAQLIGPGHSNQTVCLEPTFTLAIECTADLPDLVLDHRVLQLSAYVARVPMYYMNCALEENCAARTAFEVRNRSSHWPYALRTLLRFSTIVSNIGTSDYRPYNGSESWTWHTCHMHYHSMPYFAAYEIYQQRNGTHLALASGHKASFCLEDSSCRGGLQPKYQCSRDPWDTGNQGISVGCSDNYLHDLDCQWIDITDLPFGFYRFRVVLNPEFKSAEFNYDNNAVLCGLVFSPYQAQLRHCRIQHAIPHRMTLLTVVIFVCLATVEAYRYECLSDSSPDIIVGQYEIIRTRQPQNSCSGYANFCEYALFLSTDRYDHSSTVYILTASKEACLASKQYLIRAFENQDDEVSFQKIETKCRHLRSKDINNWRDHGFIFNSLTQCIDSLCLPLNRLTQWHEAQQRRCRYYLSSHNWNN